MDKFAEWMLVNMFGKYYAEIGEWECLKENGKPCICVSGEMLNHAISAMLMFYSMPNMEYSVEFINVDDAICPKLVKESEDNEKISYIAIKKGEKYTYNAKTVGFQICEKEITDDRLYVVYNVKAFEEKLKRYKIKEKKIPEMQYEKLIVKIEAEIHNRCISTEKNGGNYGILKNSMMLHTLRRMRILDSKEDRNALLAIRFYMGAEDSFSLMKNYVNHTKFSEEQRKTVQEFLDCYKDFIKSLNKNKNFSIDLFLKEFSKKWHKDISVMLSECIKKNSNKKDYEEMLEECLKENGKADVKKLTDEIEMGLKNKKMVS